MEPFADGDSLAAGRRHRRQMAREDEGGHDEAVGVHHGHGDGPVVGQALLPQVKEYFNFSSFFLFLHMYNLGLTYISVFL